MCKHKFKLFGGPVFRVYYTFRCIHCGHIRQIKKAILHRLTSPELYRYLSRLKNPDTQMIFWDLLTRDSYGE